MKCATAIAILISINLTTIGQHNDDDRPDFSRIIDDLVATQEGDVDQEEVYENLMQLMAEPIDLNQASYEDLQRLYLLTDKQIESFLSYRQQNGKLIRLEELQSIPEFELHTIQTLLPFVTIADPQQQLNRSFLRRVFLKQHSYLLTRVERTLETKRGFSGAEASEKRFRGSQEKTYIRFRSNRPGDFSFGLTAEKDAGETYQWNPGQRFFGADFLSYHAQVINKGKIKNLIIGDYQCQFGQGLTLGNAFGLGKGAETIITTRRNNLGLLPYTSANEAGFYRGAAAVVALLPKTSLLVFYSSVLRDANVKSDSVDQIFTSSLPLSGLHRNAAELAARKKTREISWAAVLTAKFNRLEAGLIIHQINYDQPIIKQPLAYNQFVFQGKQNTNTSVFLNYRYNNVSFFTETAKSLSAGLGVVAGAMMALHPKFDMAFLFRKFDRDFYSFYGNAFSENTSPQNETGFYWGWKYQWNRKYSFSGYVDQFKFPWLGFRRYAPAYGHEWLLRFNYQPGRKTTLFVQARQQTKPGNASSEAALYKIEDGTKQNFWLAAHYNIGEHLKLKSRIQYSTFVIDRKKTEGIAVVQDASFSFGKFQITGRYALFDTDDFDNRQYVYENDVWLAFSLPAYDGRGIRNYILVEYKFSKNLSIWFRYARTRYTDREEIGSGLDQIKGNTRNDLKFQAAIKF